MEQFQVPGSHPVNATGRAGAVDFGGLIETCRDVTGGAPHVTWVDEAFLTEQGVAPVDGLPLWVPSSVPGFNAVSVEKALAAGLTFRPLAETVRDTFEWDASLSPDQQRPKTLIPLPPPLTPEREAELLRIWRARARVG